MKPASVKIVKPKRENGETRQVRTEIAYTQWRRNSHCIDYSLNIISNILTIHETATLLPTCDNFYVCLKAWNNGKSCDDVQNYEENTAK